MIYLHWMAGKQGQLDTSVLGDGRVQIENQKVSSSKIFCKLNDGCNHAPPAPTYCAMLSPYAPLGRTSVHTRTQRTLFLSGWLLYSLFNKGFLTKASRRSSSRPVNFVGLRKA